MAGEKENKTGVARVFQTLVGQLEAVGCVNREHRVLATSRLLDPGKTLAENDLFDRFIHEADRALAASSVDAAFESGSPRSFVHRRTSEASEPTWLCTTIVPLEAENDGSPLALECTRTAQAPITPDFNERANLLETAVANLPDFVAVLDAERRFLWVNRVAPGLSMDQVLGQRLDTFVTPQTVPLLRTIVERALATGEPGQVESEGYSSSADGETRTDWYTTRVLPLKSQGRGRLLALTSVVTERKHAEMALRESEQRFRALAEHSPDLIMVINRNRTLEYVNREPAGHNREGLLGKAIDLLLHTDDREASFAAIDSVFETGLPAEYEAKAPNGETLYRVRVVQLESAPGREQALLVSTDVTQERAEDESRRNLQTRLHQAQRLESVGLLAGGIAHDFNNLLQVIQSNLHFARENLGASLSATDELEQAQIATERAAELTAHLLAIGRRQRLHPKRTDLGQLIERSVRMLRRTIPENVQIEFDPALSQDCFASVDPSQLEQVLLNLCVNARDAMPAGGRLTLRAEALPSSGEVLVSVSDTGVGISAKNLGRIFEPFFSTKGSGSGLGLAVTAGIVAAHGGSINVDSKPGQGTTFQIRLPRQDGADPEQEPARSFHTKGHETVLIAEDDDMVRAQAARVLRGAGYQVLEAGDGRQAVELFQRHAEDVDLVLLDVVMPNMDGWQTYFRIDQHKPNVKALFTTGYAASVLPSDFAGRGQQLLNKPYKPQQLLAVVRSVLDQPRDQK